MSAPIDPELRRRLDAAREALRGTTPPPTVTGRTTPPLPPPAAEPPDDHDAVLDAGRPAALRAMPTTGPLRCLVHDAPVIAGRCAALDARGTVAEPCEIVAARS